MYNFQITQTLATHARFAVFEAHREKFQFPVVLKRCEYRKVHEAEFFIRSALMKTKAKVYSQPLLSIFADVDEDKSYIVFVWKKGDALDVEVERDEESQFPPGKAGYGKSELLYKNPLTKEAAKRTLCQTLGKEVVLKISKHVHMFEMNTVFKEALTQAKCVHPNVCDFLDFRLYLGKSGHHASYIVMESLKQNLAMEMQERRFQQYDEIELMTILQQVVAALLNAKHQDLAHRDIKPHNIFRGPQGLKLTRFGSICFEELCSRTSSAIGTEMYISPEIWEATGNPEVQQRPFESDVFSLGMTMLHLAATKLPERTPTMSHSELQTLLQREVQSLRYSKEFKRLLTAMLSPAPSDRPPLEALQVNVEHIYRQASQRLSQEALDLVQQSESNLYEGYCERAIELATAAHAIYTRLPEDKSNAVNLNNWGKALGGLGRIAEAVEKYAEAHAIHSRLPEDKLTATNLNNWGWTLYNMGRNAEAVEKYAAAHAIYSRLSEDKLTATNLNNWGWALNYMIRIAEAVEKFAAAHAILSRLTEDKLTATNLNNWGWTLNNMERRAEAVEKYEAARAILSRLPEDKDTAENLQTWGWTLYKMERHAEAAEKHAAAHAIFSRLPDDKLTAANLHQWGWTLYNMGRNVEAVEKYAAAHAIHSRLSEDKLTAIDLNNWGCAPKMKGRNLGAKGITAQTILYELIASNLNLWGRVLDRMGRSTEAVEKCEAARAIYVLYQPKYKARGLDSVIARLI